MKDVIVVGGGVIGMLTTRLLHQAGLDVMLIDQGEFGSESTWAGGGILSPLLPWHYGDAVNQLAQYSHQRYETLANELTEETNVDPQWIRSGLLITDNREWITAQQWAQTYGFKVENLTSTDDIQYYEPRLSSHIKNALFLPEVAQLRNPRIAHSLRTSLRLKPITLAEFSKVQGLEVSNGRVTGVHTGLQTFKANNVVITAGAWTGLFPELNQVGVDIKPVLGQMILFRAIGLLNRIILHDGRYIIPRKDGRILCGSTLEMNGFEKRNTPAAIEELRQLAYTLVPALRDYPIVKSWSGLRPGSPNSVPYIGEHPEIKGLYVNAGHYRYGVTMGLASAQLITDMVTDKQPALDPSPYQINASRQSQQPFA